MDRANFISLARTYTSQLDDAIANIEKILKSYNAEGPSSFVTTNIFGGDPPTPTELTQGMESLQEVVDYYNDPTRLAKIVRIKQ